MRNVGQGIVVRNIKWYLGESVSIFVGAKEINAARMILVTGQQQEFLIANQVNRENNKTNQTKNLNQ